MGRTEIVPLQEKVQEEHTKSNKSFSIGLAPKDVFSRVDIANSNLLPCFAGSLQQSDTALDFQRAKNMYLETMAPGKVRNVKWYSHFYTQSINCNIRIQQ